MCWMEGCVFVTCTVDYMCDVYPALLFFNHWYQTAFYPCTLQHHEDPIPSPFGLRSLAAVAAYGRQAAAQRSNGPAAQRSSGPAVQRSSGPDIMQVSKVGPCGLALTKKPPVLLTPGASVTHVPPTHWYR